ncbi:class I SAM-dependent methyltransferase [Candidatus Micrarchaeota archaeon]|nr:class I SAM-dependent methyltransferase [Candidatus Micrarchaeota archaeon]
MKSVHFVHPRDLAVHPGQDPRRWVRNPGPAKVLEADLDRLFPGFSSVAPLTSSALTPHIRGDTNPGNLDFLLRVAAWLEPALSVEIGTFRGRSTIALAQATGAPVITCDYPSDLVRKSPNSGPDYEYLRTRDQIGELFHGREAELGITQTYADCTSPQMLRARLRKALAGRLVDFAYVDAAHTTEGILVPFRTLLPLMAEGGIIAFDDYMKDGFPGIVHALVELSREGYVFYHQAFNNPTFGTTSTVLFLNLPDCTHRQWRTEQF